MVDSRRASADYRRPATVGYLLVAVAAVSLVVQRPPVGPWDGIYGNYAVLWVSLGAASAAMLVAARREPPLTLVVGFAVLQGLTVVALAHVWGYPFGIHDPWVHAHEVDAGVLSPMRNAYPLFHALQLSLGRVTGLGTLQTLRLVAPVATVAGVLSVAPALASETGDRTAVATGVLLAVPAVFFGFVARPFTLAMPLVLVVYALVLERNWPVRTRFLALLLVLPLVWLHPFVALLVLVVLVATFVYRRVGVMTVPDRWHRPYPGPNGPMWGLLLALCVALVFHVVLLTQVGPVILDRALVALLYGTADPTGGVAGAGIIGEAFAGPDRFVEAVARLSFALLVAVYAAGGLVVAIRNGDLDEHTAVPVTSGAFVVLLFLGLSVFVPRGIGLYRVLLVGPVVALPAVASLFRARPGGGDTVRVLLALLAVTAGFVTAFNAELTGGESYSATAPQVAGVEWVDETRSADQSVVGTRMTYWLVEGLYGRDVSRAWSPTGANGRIYTRRNGAAYSWAVADAPSGALFVVDRVERTRARQAAAETGDSTPLDGLARFRQATARVYDDGGTRVYWSR